MEALQREGQALVLVKYLVGPPGRDHIIYDCFMMSTGMFACVGDFPADASHEQVRGSLSPRADYYHIHVLFPGCFQNLFSGMPFSDDRLDAGQAFVLQGLLIMIQDGPRFFVQRVLIFRPHQHVFQGRHFRISQHLIDERLALEFLHVDQCNEVRPHAGAEIPAC